MKLLIASTFLAPKKAGAERIAWETALMVSKLRGWEIHLLTTSKVLDCPPNFRVHTIPMGLVPTLYHSTLGWARIKNILIRERFDIIHSHMALPWGFVLRKSRAKKIITLHGDEYREGWWIYRALHERAFRSADVVTVPSLWLKRQMLKKYGLECTYIPNSTDTSVFKPNPNIRPDRDLVLFVGRLIRAKGVFELLEAARRLPRYRFWLAGEGNLFRIRKLPNVVWLGQLNNGRLVEAYNKASLCVFPSHFENMPLVGLEAMACGKPIIASRVGGFPEIVDDGINGILVPPKSPKALAKAIAALMATPERLEKMGAASLEKSRRFSHERIIGRYIELYESLLRAKKCE